MKSQDYFGYKIKLHFGTYLNEEEGDSTEKTVYGGFISVGINCLLFYLLFHYLKQFFENTNNTSFELETSIDWEELAKN